MAVRQPTTATNSPAVVPLHTLESFTLGSLAACSAVTLTNPFDVVKTRLVLQGQLQKNGDLLYRGPMDAVLSILKKEGPRTFFQGLIPAYGYQIFMNGTRLGIYPFLKRNLKKKLPKDTPAFPIDLASGMMAGVAGAALGSPFQLIKTRMMAYSKSRTTLLGEQHNYRGLLDGLRTVVRDEGVAGLQRAVKACMLKVAVASSVQLSTYDLCKRQLQRSRAWQGNASPTATHIVAALTASFCVVSVINPIEVVNTRLYNQTGGVYKNAVDCFRKTLAKEGVQGLYKGYPAHFMRVAPHTVLTFVFVEALRAQYVQQKARRQQHRQA